MKEKVQNREVTEETEVDETKDDRAQERAAADIADEDQGSQKAKKVKKDKESKDGKEKLKQVQVLERTKRILELIASRKDPYTMHEIAEATKIHTSTTHRLLWNLAENGFVERDVNGGWRLGLSFLEFGGLVRDRLTIREKALPFMQTLHEITGQTINLAMRRGDHVMYIEHVYAPLTGVRLARRVGALAPLHCTSGGKLFLCDCTPEEVSAYIARTKLAPRTALSIQSPEKLILELNRVKELGWAEDREELELGIQCIGAAIRDKKGTAIATMTVSSESDMHHKPEWVKHLLQAAKAISAEVDASDIC